MPTVQSKVIIAAPLDQVYALARDIERFPDFMADVQDVEILEQTPQRQLSRWVGLIKEFKRTIEWTEEDFWDDEEHTCRFQQTEGDFSEYSGTWDFKQADAGTAVVLDLSYEYDIPLIGSLIKGLLLKKMQQNCDSMLAAIKAKAEQ